VQASDDITSRLSRGEALRDRSKRVTSLDQDSGLYEEYDRWNTFNSEMLLRMFTEPSISEEYDAAGPPGEVLNLGGRNPLWEGFSSYTERQQELRRFQQTLGAKLGQLLSIQERLALIDEPAPPPQGPSTAVIGTAGPWPVIANGPGNEAAARAERPRRAAFVVHGHDDAAREATARVLAQLDVDPIILHEQANRGQTIIEKFERHSNVPFAVVLLTPDDLGRAKTETDLRERARQNVWFELGFFVGKLGRDHVCALHKGPLEIPSDIQGVIYTRMDDGGAWRYQLANELHAAGIEIDLNRLRRP
jgi:hypothetical protein